MDAAINGKKVLFVITKSNWGGAQAYVYALATSCAAHGAEVAVALGGLGEPGSESGLLAERLAARGIRTIFVKGFVRDIAAGRDIGAFGELHRLLREERPDILHLNSSKAGGLGALAGRVAGVSTIVFTAHGWAHRESRNPFSRFAIWLASSLTVLLSHRVIVVSQKDYADAPVFFSRRKIILIHNGVEAFAPLSKESARAHLEARAQGAASFKRWIVAVGELTRNKGFDVLIEAFSLLSTSHPDTALLIIGEGELRGELEKEAGSYSVRERVFLPGFVEDARHYLRAADIFAFPSRKEGLPIALLEAGVAGRAVVASATGGIPEIIEDGVTGILVPPINANRLSSSIRMLLDDDGRSARLGNALQEKVREYFSETAMIQRTLAAYVA